MGWAKIEIEFQPETHDPNEVMGFLADHFKTGEGVPTANINLVSVGIEPPPPGRAWPGPHGGSTGTHGVVLPYGYTQSDLERAADKLAHFYPTQKIQAIKELRAISHLGLKEAKDAMDAAWSRTRTSVRRNP